MIKNKKQIYREKIRRSNFSYYFTFISLVLWAYGVIKIIEQPDPVFIVLASLSFLVVILTHNVAITGVNMTIKPLTSGQRTIINRNKEIDLFVTVIGVLTIIAGVIYNAFIARLPYAAFFVLLNYGSLYLLHLNNRLIRLIVERKELEDYLKRSYKG